MMIQGEGLRLIRLSFLAEATELVGRVTRVVLELEGTTEAAPELYDELGRGLHTLKGTGGSIGLSDVAALSHELESVLAPVDRRGPLSPAIADALLQGLDQIMTMVRAGAGAASEDGGGEAGLAAEEEPALVEDTEAAGDAEIGWRVSPRQIRDLMREVERLRNARMRLEERRRRLVLSLEAIAGPTLEHTLDSAARAQLGAVLRGLASDRDEVGDVADAIEGGIKDIWTVPARMVLDPLQRVVRDACRASGKQAQLSFVGAELALDRRVVESLKGPFVHLVRNAIDHGIEPPQVRTRAGKHVAGALTIRLEQQGNMLFVEVADDGAGLDLEGIRRAARARGIVDPVRLAAMDDAAIADLVFAPGFSTRDDVTVTSGRGVGLDVAMTEVRALQGQIEVHTAPGQGTRFVISVPVDLGSSATLLVRVGELRFGIPIPTIESVLTAHPDAVQVGRTRMRLTVRDQSLPLVSLSALLGLSYATAPTEPQAALIVLAGEERLALLVDEIQGQADVMVRPLPEELRAIPAYQGVATIATGELLLVLRTPWLAEVTRTATQPIAVSRRALVVDDSVTARAIHRAVLEAAGYVVHAVGGGQQALEHLRRGTYDVAVCDVAMPEIDGLALTRRLRESGLTLPVVLVSAHDSEKDRQGALDAGADAFLSKRDCASGRLLEEVARAIARRRAEA